MILQFFTSWRVWGALPPSGLGDGVIVGWRTGRARRIGLALESMYRFVLWLVPTVEKFPRRQKLLLGDRLQVTALDVLERLLEATYTRDRRRHLPTANLGIEKLRFLCRLAKDLGHLDERRYEQGYRLAHWAPSRRNYQRKCPAIDAIRVEKAVAVEWTSAEQPISPDLTDRRRVFRPKPIRR